MCFGKGCNSKEYCHRHTAKANDLWQSYFTKTPSLDYTVKVKRSKRVKFGVATSACEYFVANGTLAYYEKHRLMKEEERNVLTQADFRRS
jgi:hypothetical protein